MYYSWVLSSQTSRAENEAFLLSSVQLLSHTEIFFHVSMLDTLPRPFVAHDRAEDIESPARSALPYLDKPP